MDCYKINGKEIPKEEFEKDLKESLRTGDSSNLYYKYKITSALLSQIVSDITKGKRPTSNVITKFYTNFPDEESLKEYLRTTQAKTQTKNINEYLDLAFTKFLNLSINGQDSTIQDFVLHSSLVKIDDDGGNYKSGVFDTSTNTIHIFDRASIKKNLLHELLHLHLINSNIEDSGVVNYLQNNSLPDQFSLEEKVILNLLPNNLGTIFNKNFDNTKYDGLIKTVFGINSNSDVAFIKRTLISSLFEDSTSFVDDRNTSIFNLVDC